MSDISIKGVDILTSNDIMIPVFKWADICSAICFLIFMMCLAFLVTAIQYKKKILVSIFLLLSVILISLASFFVYLTTEEKASGIREYKATISEDANFIEIDDRFDVVSKEGKLYILRDKVTNESDKQKGE